MDRIKQHVSLLARALIVVDADVEAAALELRADLGDTVTDPMDFDDDLFDQRPVLLLDTSEHIELAFLDVELEQVDLPNAVLGDDLGDGPNLTRHGFAAQASAQETLEVGL